MAKALDKFTDPFRQSAIPFLLAEVVTDGRGEMVDLICRFANGPAAALARMPQEELQGLRFTRAFPAGRLEALRPLQAVAFSGSAASFSYPAADGRELRVTCYQPMYGMAACLLEPPEGGGRTAMAAESLPSAAAVVELSRNGLRCLSFNRRLCELTGWPRKSLLDRFAGDLSALVEPADWPDLLQDLLDAARERRGVDHDFRLRRRAQAPLWVSLRAEAPAAAGSAAVFQAVLLDIDRQRQAQSRLEEALAELERARSGLSALFENLPGGVCLFRLAAEGGAAPLRLSRDLCGLLGYPEPELLRRLEAEGPMWRVFAADREELSAAAARAWALDAPLRHVCRVRPRGGGTAWLSLEAVRRPQGDGSALLYAACFDVTREKTAEAELRLRSRLCELLLDRSQTVSFDYDPAADSARVESRDAAGRRAVRTLPDYLKAPSETIHPEDWPQVAEAVRCLSARSGAETLEYRGDYDGRGWRWYQASWVSLFDRQGSVYRLLGKADDVTGRKLEAARFRSLAAGQKRRSQTALCAARLDLSENHILDARGSGKHLARVLFGNTAEECLSHVRDNIPGPEDRARFDALFRRGALLDAFLRGTARLSLEHPFLSDGSGRAVRARSEAELAENPETRHAEVFFRVQDAEKDQEEARALGLLARRDYAFVLAVDAESGACRSLAGPDLPEGTRYRPLRAGVLRGLPPSARRAALRRALRLETVLAELDRAAAYTVRGERTRLCWSWLDRDAGTLLLTGQTLE